MIFLWEKNIDTSLLDFYFGKNIKKDKLLFFDIETKGLGFTKSNLIFLIGIGLIIDNRFLVKQFVVSDIEKEGEMYKTILKEIKKDTIIFTYNGEKFDIPLFLKRLKMQKREKESDFISSLCHIDLLKIARRSWKKRIGSCSLKNVEEKILNIVRNEDLPGYLVPAFFEMYLKENNMKYLKKILQHNRQDILSLYHILENIIKEDIAYGKKRISIPTN